MRPDMYCISSFHSWNSSGLLTTMLAILAPESGGQLLMRWLQRHQLWHGWQESCLSPGKN